MESYPIPASIGAIAVGDPPGDKTGNHEVNQPSADYQWMANYWDLIDLVADGFESAKSHAAAIIPPHYREQDEAYQSRLKHLDFLPLFSQLVKLSASILTRKAVTIVTEEGEPSREIIEGHLEGVDGQGNSVDVFLHGFLNKFQLRYSIGYVMVDAPCIPLGVDGLPVSLSIAQEAALNLRPYWLAISPRDVIGLIYSQQGARKELVQARIRSSMKVRSGLFSEKMVPTVKVYDLIDAIAFGKPQKKVACSTWVETRDADEKSAGWVPIPEQYSEMQLPYIPLFCMNTNPVAKGVARPDLYELAVLNINHTRVASSLSFCLNLAACMKLKRTRSVEAATSYETTSAPIDMSPDKLLEAEIGEDFSWMTIPTNAFDALERKIEKHEKDAKELWLQRVHEEKSYAESGHSKTIGQNQGNSKLLATAIALESLLAECMQAHFDLIDKTKVGVKPPIKLSVNRELDAAIMSAQVAERYSDMVDRGQLSKRSHLELLKRGQLLPEDFDIEAEVDRLSVDPFFAPADLLQPDDSPTL